MKQQQQRPVLFMNLEGRLPKDNPFQDQTPLLMKYFPKYQKSMTLRNQAGAFRHKVKSIKVLRQYYTQIGLEKSKQWRVILANKMKSVKSIGQVKPNDPQIINKVKLFTGLKKLQILLDHSPFAPRIKPEVEEVAMRKLWRKIDCLQNLKSLHIIGLPKQHKAFIKDLRSSQRLLSSLREFELCPDSEGYESAKYLEILSNEKEIMKHVTNLSFGPLFSPLHFECFQNLADSCPKLSTLGFEFYCQNLTFFRGEQKVAKNTFPVTTNYLATLKAFTNLKSLQLSIADTATFFKDIVFPPSIQDLALNFLEVLTEERMLAIYSKVPDEATRQLFEQHFYGQFQSLHKLDSLKLTFENNCDQESFKTHASIFQGLLRRVPTLRKLNIDRSFCSGDLNKPFGGEIKDFSLPQILESCHHLGETLETIEIGHDRAIYPKLDLSASRNKFNKLSKIKMTGKLEDNDNNYLHLLGQLAALGGSLTSIKLWTFGKNTVEALLELLKQVNKIERTSGLHIEIQMRFDSYRDLEHLKGDLEQIKSEMRMTEKGYMKARGVSLVFYTDVKAGFSEDFLKIYGEKFDRLEIRSKYLNFRESNDLY